MQDDADSKDTWWLDEHTKEMLERDMAQPTGPDSALLFTVRDGEPLRLTKEQVRGLSQKPVCERDYRERRLSTPRHCGTHRKDMDPPPGLHSAPI